MRDSSTFICGVNSKSKESWQELYSYFYAALCNYSRKITNDPHASEDIVQGMLIKLWDSNIIFTDLSGLTAYLYKSVYSRSLNFKRDNRKGVQMDSASIPGQSSIEEDYIRMALEEEIISRFYKALEEMSPQQREIILMTLRGDKIDDISRKLNISPNSVKTQKKRAYTFLRGKLGTSFVIVKLLLFA